MLSWFRDHGNRCGAWFKPLIHGFLATVPVPVPVPVAVTSTATAVRVSRVRFCRRRSWGVTATPFVGAGPVAGGLLDCGASLMVGSFFAFAVTGTANRVRDRKWRFSRGWVGGGQEKVEFG